MDEATGLRELERRLRESGAFERVQHDPTVLIRFLAAGGRDPKKAAGLVEAMLRWRTDSGIDRLVREFEFAERGVCMEAYPQGYHKTDKKGRPVYIQQLGRADIDTVMAVTTEQRLVSLHIQEVEKLFGVILPACNALAGAAPRATAAAPPAVRGTCSVLDLSGVGFGSLIKAKRLLTLFLALDAAYFPDTIDAMLVIGAPSWFSGVLAAMRALLTPEQQARMEVIPGDYRPRLRELIGAENLLDRGPVQA
ncbi:SEC14 cytosolic factor [Monoraphidium neglectum]|uniref:SEC14 cytosolic factor n=1 Tax=Monoraphidium neglectum TaxID=145388 RepID=A0A0D2MNV9_9CHLO|nr:SEC14 cytosolic factor [Monoraphidium neglectum]KIZ04390.1 SEC14 cytosolic factor [Monoraphidium neglectum]|eukprot:XP_013903409.1 SEC14 cytosolic factor [Monoraphidium neglectum]